MLTKFLHSGFVCCTSCHSVVWGQWAAALQNTLGNKPSVLLVCACLHQSGQHKLKQHLRTDTVIYRCSPEINTHARAHTLVHTRACTRTHKRTDYLHYLHPGVSACKRPTSRQSDHAAEASPSPFLCSVRISLGQNGNFILQGLILAWASRKIPFKWSQAEKRQRICLAFCFTVFSPYMTWLVPFFSAVTHCNFIVIVTTMCDISCYCFISFQYKKQ